MLGSYGYLLSLYIFCFLFLISYILPLSNDVVFMLYFTRNNKEAANRVKLFRIFFSYISICFFILSAVFIKITENILYTSSLISVFVTLILLKFYKENKEITQIKLNHIFSETRPSYFIKITRYHYTLHLFTILYMFYITKEFQTKNTLLFESFYYINPLTAIFVSGLFFFAFIFIKNAPDFANKKLKGYILNYIYLASFTVLFILLAFSEFMMYELNYIYLIYQILFALILIALNIIYLLYIKTENRPFEFKTENGKISSKKVIELSFDGTKIFLNLKSKKSCLISAGLILYFTVYILLVYLLSI